MTSTTPSQRSGIKERRADDWGVVIKVKYCDTLKRFTAFVHQPTMIFEYDMNKLRYKISSLFMIDHDAALILTYTDEDGDVVALDNDEELQDAVIYQRLNPLNIHVKLKPSSASNSMPMPFPRLTAEFNATAKETLKLVPDPICGFLTNACHDLLQAASSVPAIAELLKPLSNMQVDLNRGQRPNVSLGDDHLPRTSQVSSSPKVIQQTHEVGNVSQNSNPAPPVDAVWDRSTERTPMVSVDPHLVLPAMVPSAFHCGRLQHPYRRSRSCNDRSSHTFHRGVICDGCGMHPIVGPRYKSTVKDDYDLCSACFHNMGRDAEYTRIDWSGFSFPKVTKHYRKLHRARLPRAAAPLDGSKEPVTRLDSRFISDVTVGDGTAMLPGSGFTKIWRMLNNGPASWPLGTQLVWVGGDRFGAHASSQLELLEPGFPPDAELDIAVDLVAPSITGHYRSYWQMALPSGQKFGEHVWVAIQVDLQPASARGSRPVLNLNSLPESSRQNNPFAVDVDSEPMDCIAAEPEPPAMPLLLELATPVSPNTSSLIDFPASSSQDPCPLVDIPSPSEPLESTCPPPVEEENPVEQALLRELEEMGFKQVELNQEILRWNRYDLEKSLDDLCEFEEWDPLLNELHEMGFGDRDLNKKLLSKNGGSIKRVVMDLIAAEKGD